MLSVTVPDQYFCTKHPDLNINARENKNQAGTQVPACKRRNIHLCLGYFEIPLGSLRFFLVLLVTKLSTFRKCMSVGGFLRNYFCAPFGRRVGEYVWSGMYIVQGELVRGEVVRSGTCPGGSCPGGTCPF